MFQLRQLQAVDLPRVSELFAEAFGVSPTPPLEYFTNLAYSDPEGCVVGVEDGEIVAYAISHTNGQIGYIGNLAVAKAQRGKGYGRAVTNSVREHLSPLCSIVGLAVESSVGRNLELYTSIGFETILPSVLVYKRLDPKRPRVPARTIKSAAQLGTDAEAAIRDIASWSGEIYPGLDFTHDLELFLTKYPEQLWIDSVDGAVRGFLAYEDSFRGDPFGAVRPGSQDTSTLANLVRAVETGVDGEHLFFHFHGSCRRIGAVLRDECGYRIACHRTSMLLEGQAEAWNQTSDKLLLRPWWT